MISKLGRTLKKLILGESMRSFIKVLLSAHWRSRLSSYEFGETGSVMKSRGNFHTTSFGGPRSIARQIAIKKCTAHFKRSIPSSRCTSHPVKAITAIEARGTKVNFDQRSLRERSF